MKSWISFLTELADKTDKLAQEYFCKVNLKVEYKKDKSPVTEADKTIEEMIRNQIYRKSTGLGIYGEEFGEDKNKELRLIIDPIDGTRNFIRGIPIFATLLAVEQAGEVIAGLVSAPLLSSRWFAEKKKGAFYQNSLTGTKKKMAVSRINSLYKAQLFHASLSGNETREKAKQSLLKIINATERQRGFGDFYQHVLVAQGSGELAVDPYAAPWDIAALKIILTEAGGKLTSLAGKDSIYEGSALSSNGLLHNQVLQLLS